MAELGDRMSTTIGLGQPATAPCSYAGESFDVVRRGRMIAQIVPLDDSMPRLADVDCEGE
jgi:hypothetical protein